MRITERNEIELRSKESAGGFRCYSSLVVAAALSGAAASYDPAASELPKISMKLVSGSYPAMTVRNRSFESGKIAVITRTELSKKLRQLRANAIANGMSLLSADEISLERQKRRGERS